MEVYFPPSVFFFWDDDGGGERRCPTTLSLLPRFFRGTKLSRHFAFFSGKSGDGTRTYSTLDFRLRFSPLRRVCMQSGHFRLSSLPERERGEKRHKKSRKCQTRRRFEFLNLNRWKKSIIWESLSLCSGQNGHSRNLVPPTRSQLIRLFSIFPLRFYLGRTQRARRSKRKKDAPPHIQMWVLPHHLFYSSGLSLAFFVGRAQVCRTSAKEETRN